jgi:hypothetical protein
MRWHPAPVGVPVSGSCTETPWWLLKENIPYFFVVDFGLLQGLADFAIGFQERWLSATRE